MNTSKTYQAKSYRLENGLPELKRQYTGMTARDVGKLGFRWAQKRKRAGRGAVVKHNRNSTGYLIRSKHESLVVSPEEAN